MTLPEELERLKEFHGHLGPWAVVGYRMGKIARRRFPNKIWGVVYSGSKPPISCMIDGVQFTSCCTLGKDNIRVKEEDEAKGRFYDQNTLMEIRLEDGVRERIGEHMSKDTEEELSMEIWNAKDEEIFRIIEGESLKEDRIVKLK
ncbi:MAG: formylmethanofuran dehydrogenase subunit E family protein [Methanomassiliicoccales archaeon]